MDVLNALKIVNSMGSICSKLDKLADDKTRINELKEAKDLLLILQNQLQEEIEK